jgi:oxygen-dependent protoporphyrinogen oxidase
MADLAARMATRLDGSFRRGHRVEAVRRTADGWTVSGDEQLKADHVVLAVAPHVAAGLVTGSLAEALGGAEAAPVVVVGLGGPDMSIPAGFGILTGPDAGTATRGILLESSYAPHRAPAGASLVKVIAGGAPGRPLLDLDDAGLVEVIGAEVAQVLRTDLDVTFTEVIRHRHGIPQYVIGHRRWLASVESATCESMHLTGWGYRGVGMAHLATDALRIAETITA